MDATEYLHIEARPDGPVYVCRCGHALGDARQNIKAYTLMEEGPVHEAGLRVNPYRVSDRFVFRQFYCPACLLRLETEVELKDEPVLWDIQVDVSHQP